MACEFFLQISQGPSPRALKEFESTKCRPKNPVYQDLSLFCGIQEVTPPRAAVFRDAIADLLDLDRCGYWGIDIFLA